VGERRKCPTEYYICAPYLRQILLGGQGQGRSTSRIYTTSGRDFAYEQVYTIGMVKAGEVDNPNPGIHSESQARRQIMTISFIIIHVRDRRKQPYVCCFLYENYIDPLFI
jgi:hypothetical protein